MTKRTKRRRQKCKYFSQTQVLSNLLITSVLRNLLFCIPKAAVLHGKSVGFALQKSRFCIAKTKLPFFCGSFFTKARCCQVLLQKAQELQKSQKQYINLLFFRCQKGDEPRSYPYHRLSSATSCIAIPNFSHSKSRAVAVRALVFFNYPYFAIPLLISFFAPKNN